jgi:hypothetical protein
MFGLPRKGDVLLVGSAAAGEAEPSNVELPRAITSAIMATACLELGLQLGIANQVLGVGSSGLGRALWRFAGGGGGGGGAAAGLGSTLRGEERRGEERWCGVVLMIVDSRSAYGKVPRVRFPSWDFPSLSFQRTNKGFPDRPTGSFQKHAFLK